MFIENATHSSLIKLLPEFTQGLWEITHFKQGNTNVVSLIKNDSYKFIIRIFGSEGLIDRPREFININILSKNKLAPAIVKTFDNGMILEYVDGKVLSDTEMIQNFKGILTTMKSWHLINLNDFKNLTIKHNYFDIQPAMRETINKVPVLLNIIMKWYHLALVKHAGTIKGYKIDEVLREIEEDTVGMQLGFCHNDLLSSNIIQQNNGKIVFIDYEYAGINFIAFDIANHLAEYAGYDLNYSLIPDEIGINKILSGYDKDIISQVMYFLPITHLMWGLWALLREGTFDYFKYGDNRLKRFMETYQRYNKIG